MRLNFNESNGTFEILELTLEQFNDILNCIAYAKETRVAHDSTCSRKRVGKAGNKS